MKRPAQKKKGLRNRSIGRKMGLTGLVSKKRLRERGNYKLPRGSFAQAVAVTIREYKWIKETSLYER